MCCQKIDPRAAVVLVVWIIMVMFLSQISQVTEAEAEVDQRTSPLLQIFSTTLPWPFRPPLFMLGRFVCLMPIKDLIRRPARVVGTTWPRP